MKRWLATLSLLFAFACDETPGSADLARVQCGNDVCSASELCCSISCGSSAGAPECIGGVTSCPVATCDAGTD